MQRRSSALTVAMSRTFKRQTLWDVPLAQGEMNMAFNATSRNYLTNEESTEDVLDCTGENLLIELVTSRHARLIMDFDVDPNQLAGWTSFNYGAAASPSGGTSEVQTLTSDGSAITGGTLQVRFTVNYNTQISAAIAFGANAAAWQAALEAMPNIGAGNVLVTGGPIAAAPIVVTFQGALANLDVGLLEVLSALAPGGAHVTVDETTPGVGRTHNISPIVGYTLPFTTAYVGFRGSDKQPVIFKNIVCSVLRCRATRTETGQERITATVQLFGSADLQKASGYVMPGCEDIEPMRFGDSALLINGSDIYQPGSIYADPNSGLALAREWEYYHDNGVTPKFDGAGIDVTRLERANVRQMGYNIGVLGEQGDPLWEIAKQQNPRSIASISLRVGTPNNNVRFNAPQSILKLDNPALPFVGRDNESNIRMMARPKSITGDPLTPTNVVATTKQQVAYLIAA
jgi:hypothetical protein